ncbi:hypothetical protein M422DRAFT_261648 [Sphaerobolus stellatus SS14]|uniref:Peptidase C14 caspase domain-containing protein n=1 Tax=Sphaerobolus stellatus (strain SS14) TaxID=990650 RepID=A0A0C9VFA9_SPHS4|nr:hypothetical protein M422DRAFT_261648 [Sphaerobolus stellatus SS14]
MASRRVSGFVRKVFSGRSEGSNQSVPPEKKTLFALIVGINDYAVPAAARPLKGAVVDAEAFRNYLVKHLHVPENNIRVLLNRRATREKIILGFNALKEDVRIAKEDPILIYFAGHGMETDSPKGWECGDPENKIQMIVPHDFGKRHENSTVHGIPDLSIRCLLEGIADKKGNNITVILDCCHSGSGTRGEADDSSSLIRSVDVDVEVPPGLDESIRCACDTSRGIALPRESYARGAKSHVLLAACGRQETAREKGGRGYFTKALLKLLEAVGPENLTYASVLEKIGPILEQSPQCEGDNRNRILFNLRPPPAALSHWKIRMNKGNYILHAGAIHGVTVGDEYCIYPSPEASSMLGVLIVWDVKSIRQWTTVLYPQPRSELALTDNSVAVRSKVGKTFSLIFKPPSHSKQCLELYKEIGKKLGKEAHTGIRLDKSGIEAKLAMSVVTKDEIAFDVLDHSDRMDGNGNTRIPHTVSPGDELYSVLHAIAHYYRCLEYKGMTSGIERAVSVTFTELEYHSDNFDMRPVGRSLNHNRVVDISVEEHKRYGFKVINRSSYDLYMNAIYFDNMDFSIKVWYQSHTAGRFVTDPTIPKNGGSISVGYGDGGGLPYKFSLDDNAQIETGFLKLYLTSTNVDLSCISQDSPFKGDRRKGEQVKAHTLTEIWGTISLKFIQRRHRPYSADASPGLRPSVTAPFHQ